MGSKRIPSRPSALGRLVIRASMVGLLRIVAPTAAQAAPLRPALPRASAMIQVRPTAGPAGSKAIVKGSSFSALIPCRIFISFADAQGVSTGLASLPPSSGFSVKVRIPADAAKGAGSVIATQLRPLFPHDPFCRVLLFRASATFNVSSLPQRWSLSPIGRVSIVTNFPARIDARAWCS